MRDIARRAVGPFLPGDWLGRVAQQEGHMLAATIAHHVRFFVVSNPWEPMTDIVRWAAPLVGAFIVALAVHLKRRSGPSAQVH